MIQLFRVLLPSWKFFDGLVDAPVLYHRVSQDGVNFGEWSQTIPKAQKRRFKNLLLNSNENYLFAAHALLEYFKNDLQEKSDSQVSLELIKNLVLYRLKELDQISEVSFFQIRLISLDVEYYSETLGVRL